MRRLKLLIADQRGSAPLEFIGAGLVMLVPLFYLVITLAQIQSQSFGIDAAARYVARVVAQNPAAVSSAAENAALIAGQYGIDEDTLRVSIECDVAGPCPAAGALMTVRVEAFVRLPLVPEGLSSHGSVRIETQSTQKISEYVVTP